MVKEIKPLESIWETYTQSWKVSIREEKMDLYASSLTLGVIYHAPDAKTKGFEELADQMIAFHQQVPGGHFITTKFLSHSNKSIAIWNMHNGQGEKIGEGVSYGEYNEDGKLTSMTGFF
ncbi:MAG: hypothetical protein JKY88_15115 [Pseudomonadales bacterium]|nr:hypothetical protein [Pseudomonadales bacterium]